MTGRKERGPLSATGHMLDRPLSSTEGSEGMRHQALVTTLSSPIAARRNETHRVSKDVAQ